MKLKFVPLLIAASSLMLPGLLLAQDTQPSLAEVAKQKSTSAKAKKVISDEDMPSTSAPPPPPASPATGAATSSASSSSTGAAAGETKPPSDLSGTSDSTTAQKVAPG